MFTLHDDISVLSKRREDNMLKPKVNIHNNGFPTVENLVSGHNIWLRIHKHELFFMQVSLFPLLY